jgi:hypothetical protein
VASENVVPFPERERLIDPALPWDRQDHAMIFAYRAVVSIVPWDAQATADAFRELFDRAIKGQPVEDPPGDGVFGVGG